MIDQILATFIVCCLIIYAAFHGSGVDVVRKFGTALSNERTIQAMEKFMYGSSA